MNREKHRQADRKRVFIALGVSAAVHAAALATLKLDVPTFAEAERSRALEVVELSDRWEDRATQVIALETATAVEVAETSEGAGTQTTSATSARVEVAEPGAAGVETTVAALIDLVGDPGAAQGEPSLDLSIVEAESAAPVVVAVAPRRANRGIVRRESGGGAAGSTGFDFVASSDAARDRERERGGNGFGGFGGIGVSVIGGGVDCDAPNGGLTGLGRPTFGGAINRIGGSR